MGAKVILFNGLINGKLLQKFSCLQFITFNNDCLQFEAIASDYQ